MVDPKGIMTLAPNGRVITFPCVCPPCPCGWVSMIGGDVILPGILVVQWGVVCCVVVSGMIVEVVAPGKRLSPT